MFLTSSGGEFIRPEISRTIWATVGSCGQDVIPTSEQIASRDCWRVAASSPPPPPADAGAAHQSEAAIAAAARRENVKDLNDTLILCLPLSWRRAADHYRTLTDFWRILA